MPNYYLVDLKLVANVSSTCNPYPIATLELLYLVRDLQFQKIGFYVETYINLVVIPREHPCDRTLHPPTLPDYPNNFFCIKVIKKHHCCSFTFLKVGIGSVLVVSSDITISNQPVDYF